MLTDSRLDFSALARLVGVVTCSTYFIVREIVAGPGGFTVAGERGKALDVCATGTDRAVQAWRVLFPAEAL